MPCVIDLVPVDVDGRLVYAAPAPLSTEAGSARTAVLVLAAIAVLAMVVLALVMMNAVMVMA
jgi:hypothetical protein